MVKKQKHEGSYTIKIALHKMSLIIKHNPVYKIKVVMLSSNSKCWAWYNIAIKILFDAELRW